MICFASSAELRVALSQTQPEAPLHHHSCSKIAPPNAVLIPCLTLDITLSNEPCDTISLKDRYDHLQTHASALKSLIAMTGKGIGFCAAKNGLRFETGAL
jgi:hypothetical protein